MIGVGKKDSERVIDVPNDVRRRDVMYPFEQTKANTVMTEDGGIFACNRRKEWDFNRILSQELHQFSAVGRYSDDQAFSRRAPIKLRINP
jgi:hypothetical protein